MSSQNEKFATLAEPLGQATQPDLSALMANARLGHEIFSRHVLRMTV